MAKDKDKTTDRPPPGLDSNTPAQLEVAHLRERVHEMEEAVHAYLSRQTSVGHDRISTWLDRVKHRFTAPSTPQAPEETTPDTASTNEDQTE